jgi:hydroxyacylglutathione hydrolase
MNALCKKAFINNLHKKTLVIDTRDVQGFSKGFVKGSIFIGWDNNFLYWLQKFVDKNSTFVMVVNKDYIEVITNTIESNGYKNCKGYITEEKLNGTDICNSNCATTATIELDFIDTCAAEEVKNYFDIAGIVIVDVRSEEDNMQLRIKKSMWIPLLQLQSRINMFDKEKTYLLYCTNGYKSTIASSLLIGKGISKVINIYGGIEMLKHTQTANNLIMAN